ncbi:MAG: hypothetical protein Q9160_003953 [Pyrenula sp. 1 TL-2023]
MTEDSSTKPLSPPTSEPTTTLPKPPFIDIPNVPNFRGLGSYSTSSSTCTRSILFRSAVLSFITPEGVDLLTKTYHVRTIFDFRSGAEIKRHADETPIVDIPGTTRIFAPVFEDEEDHDPIALAEKYKAYIDANGAEGYIKAYRSILQNAGNSYRQVFDWILRWRSLEQDGAALFHCSAGKDRTGVLSALILTLVGVPKKKVVWEYGLTDNGLGKWKQTILKHFIENENMTEAEAERIAGVKEENMEAVLKRLVEEEYGGVEAYLKNVVGLSNEELQKVKAILTEDSPGAL